MGDQSSPEVDEAPAGETLGDGERSIAHIWELFFGPEIERRQASGSLPANFFLYMAQVLFSPDAKPPTILLNEEVKGIGLMRAPRSIQKGDALLASDLQHVERFDLPDELLDNGHCTIIRAGERWHMFFNFLTGRAKAKDMLELAGQFLDAALFSKTKGDAGPAVDNLFSASELISKAELILQQGRGLRLRNGAATNQWRRSFAFPLSDRPNRPRRGPSPRRLATTFLLPRASGRAEAKTPPQARADVLYPRRRVGVRVATDHS